MDETIDQGNVSIWDISDPKSPKFIKRLKAGKELPEDLPVETQPSAGCNHTWN
jgi:hypothetical protein